MTAVAPRTNADVIAPVVGEVKRRVGDAVAHFKDHPDEMAVAVAPLLMLTLATRRHHLNFAEAALVTECGYWSGYFAWQAYRQWKDKPAGTVPRLRKVN